MLIEMTDVKMNFLNVLIFTCQFAFYTFFHTVFSFASNYSANYICNKNQTYNHIYLQGEQWIYISFLIYSFKKFTAERGIRGLNGNGKNYNKDEIKLQMLIDVWLSNQWQRRPYVSHFISLHIFPYIKICLTILS